MSDLLTSNLTQANAAGLNTSPSALSRHTASPLTTSASSDLSLVARSSQNEFSVANTSAAPKQATLLWRDEITGRNVLWLMNGTNVVGSSELPTVLGASWKVEATADFNQDGKADILWRDYASGQNVVWFMNGTTPVGGALINTLPGANWQIEAAADFNQDGRADILWRDYASGQNVVWFMNGTTPVGGALINTLPGENLRIETTSDFNQDGKIDIFWRDDTGVNSFWLMDGTTVTGGGFIAQVPGGNWSAISLEITLPGQEPPPGTRQLTNNNFQDLNPRVSGNNIVWQGWDGNDYEIFMVSGNGNPIQLTNNNTQDVAPQISGNLVVWQQYTPIPNAPNNATILLYDGVNAPRAIGSNRGGEANVRLSGTKVVWDSWGGTTNDIFLYDAATPNIAARNLTNNTPGGPSSFNPVISGNDIVWEQIVNRVVGNQGFTDNHIAWYDGNQIRLLTNNTDELPNITPRVSGNLITWQRFTGYGDTFDIYLYDKTSNTGPRVIASGSLGDSSSSASGLLDFSGSTVVWTSQVNGKSQLFSYNNGNIRQVSSAQQDVFQARVDGGNIVWVATETGIAGTSLYRSTGNGSQLLGRSGANAFYSRLDISGNRIVWQLDDMNDEEIMTATLN